MKRLIYLVARFIYNLFKSSTSSKYRAAKRIKEKTIQAIKKNVRKKRFKHPQPIGRVIDMPVGHKRVKVGGARTRFKLQYETQRKRIFKSTGRRCQYLLIDA